MARDDGLMLYDGARAVDYLVEEGKQAKLLEATLCDSTVDDEPMSVTFPLRNAAEGGFRGPWWPSAIDGGSDRLERSRANSGTKPRIASHGNLRGTVYVHN